VDWLTAPESATSVAIFRIASAISIALVVLPTLRDGAGVVWVGRAWGGVSTLPVSTWYLPFGGVTVQASALWVGLALAAAMAMLLGLGGRITAFVALQACLAVVDVNSDAGGSYDELMFNGLWLLVLAGGTQTLSLDAWLRTGRVSPPATIGRWARFLVVFQLILVYATTGWQKLSSHWVPGGGSTALYYILQQPTWQRGDNTWLAFEPWYTFTRIGTAVTWIWEVTAPLWLLAWAASIPGARWGRWLVAARLRGVYAAIGLGLHASLLVAMDVGPFSWVSLAYYAAIVHPGEWDELLRR
jgi:hypothetical protein